MNNNSNNNININNNKNNNKRINTYKAEIYFENTTKCSFLVDDSEDNITVLSDYISKCMSDNRVCNITTSISKVCIDTKKINYFKILKINK